MKGEGGKGSFCTCNNPGCAKHPGNRGGECTACIRSNLKGRTLPRCFFAKLTGDIEGMTDWSYERFARLVFERADETESLDSRGGFR